MSEATKQHPRTDGAPQGLEAIQELLLGDGPRQKSSMSAKPKNTPDKAKASWPFMAWTRKSGDQAGPSASREQRVAPGNNTLDLAPGVFTWDDPQAIAQSLKDSADLSERRRAPAFQAAMSVLTFYINRGGGQLPAGQRAALDAAKDELRSLYDRARHGKPILEAASKN